MSTITVDGHILVALLTVASIGSIHIAGRMAERRGRSFKTWAYIDGVFLGPLAIPLVFMFSNLRGKDGGRA